MHWILLNEVKAKKTVMTYDRIIFFNCDVSSVNLKQKRAITKYWFFFKLIDDEKQVKQKVHGKTYKSYHSHWLSVHIALELSMEEDWARALGYGTGNIIKRNLLVN